MVAACPLAFSEVSVKGRIKAVLNYKRPTFWLVLAAIFSCVIVSACLLTNPPTETTKPSEPPFPVSEHLEAGDYNELYFCMETDDQFSPFYKASIYLDTKNQKFMLTISPLSSYAGLGNYEYRENGKILVLKTHDGLYTYTFNVRSDDLIFDGINSIATAWDAFEDGAIFSAATFTQPYFNAYGSIDADIDGDGVIEHCSMGFGPTSGLFTFTFSATANGEGKYFNIFNPKDWYQLSFVETNGKVQVCGESQDGLKHYFDISVKEGNVVLTEDGSPLTYWVGQGKK